MLSNTTEKITLNFNEYIELKDINEQLIISPPLERNDYKIIPESTVTKKVEIEIGLRKQGLVEVKSGLVNGDTVVAEGLKKTRPNGKIKPIK